MTKRALVRLGLRRSSHSTSKASTPAGWQIACSATQRVEVTKHLKTQLAGWVTQGERKRSPEAAFAEGAHSLGR